MIWVVRNEKPFCFSKNSKIVIIFFWVFCVLTCILGYLWYACNLKACNLIHCVGPDVVGISGVCGGGVFYDLEIFCFIRIIFRFVIVWFCFGWYRFVGVIFLFSCIYDISLWMKIYFVLLGRDGLLVSSICAPCCWMLWRTIGFFPIVKWVFFYFYFYYNRWLSILGFDEQIF